MLTKFIPQQVDRIRVGGWPVLRRKLLKVALLPVALPVVLVIRLISSWLLIRIGVLISPRIGHFAANTELYLCERDAGINVPNKRYVDLWYYCGPICNRQLAKMWERTILIGPSLLLSLLDRLNGLLPGYEVYRIDNHFMKCRDIHNLLSSVPAHLSFLPEEEQEGQAGLKALGIFDRAPFVCLNVRDNAYLTKACPFDDWRYHDYRDSNISNYVLAAQEIASRGYFVVRMGSVVKDPLPVFDPMIIDYATNGMRSDFMDIYLSANCAFFISTGAGLDAVPYIFRLPVVYVNYSQMESLMTFDSRSISITKKYWLRYEKRFMTFRAIFESGAGLFCESKQFEEMGIELIENTPEEIAAAVLEMEARLKETWQTTEEDEELQKRFWDIFPRSVSEYNGKPMHGKIKSRMGAEFLRQNKSWLE